MDEVKININEIKGISLINVEGRLDSETYEGLWRAIGTLMQEGKTKIVVEMSKVDYISSAGWSVFIANLREAHRRKGDIFLAGMTEHVKEVYELLELNEILKSFDKAQDAILGFEYTTAQ